MLQVGYIVGLGDRHSMNILLDQASAEVVHIDLGVAFEQGLMLKTPERVPFRLTREIIDGMGVSGVEGIFRRCCEATLSVMRTNKEALLTIIEVFIYDPLYKWALSPLKALERQQVCSRILLFHSLWTVVCKLWSPALQGYS
jgi:ataxia telangiectasia mutated family protein